MMRVIILGLLGGVRVQDALEAISYERLRPPLPRGEAVGPVAAMLLSKTDEIVSGAKAGAGKGRL